jgi:MFS family permease
MTSTKGINRIIIYFVVFLFTLHFTPATYIESSFLEQFMSTEKVGLIFSLSAILTIITFFVITKLLRKFGNFKVFSVVILIEIISLFILASSLPPYILIIAYIFGFMLRTMAYFSLDIFLEALTQNKETGGIRGYYLTIINIAFFLGPILTSFILTDHQYYKIFIISAILEIPVLYLALKYLKNFEDPFYQKPNLIKNFRKIQKNTDIYSTIISDFLLKFFYAWMIVYTPIFLISVKGFSLSETTLMISIGLIPFLILQSFLGKIADKYVGEKEILTAGFLIMGLATMSFSFFDSSNFFLWSAILFVTRIGAAMVEAMTETHLFKRIDSTNINAIGIFRISRPIAYLVASVIGSILMLFIDFKYLFLILGVIMFYGVRFALAIEDTK